MGFKALLNREDFFGILQKTLMRYFKEQGIENVQISYDRRDGAREYVLVPELGMIMQPFPSKVIRAHYYSAYNIRNNRIKNLIAKAAVFTATHSKNLLSMKQHLYLFPRDAVNDDTIFSVCNRSIRIFDFQNSRTVSIEKQGFTDKFFTNQLRFRLENKYEFIPPILRHGSFWFEEPLLDGHMLARETDKARFDQSMHEAVDCMKRIAADTMEYSDAECYCRELADKLQNLFDKAKQTKEIATVQKTESLLSEMTPRLRNIDGKMPTAVTHGDLQAGNVWIDCSGKTWVIDWETQERRSIWFDIATLEYSTRYNGGIQSLIDGIDNAESTKRKLCYMAECELSLQDMLLIFVAEDIIFNLEDMLELPLNGGGTSFDRYIDELFRIEWKKLYSGMN